MQLFVPRLSNNSPDLLSVLSPTFITYYLSDSDSFKLKKKSDLIPKLSMLKGQIILGGIL